MLLQTAVFINRREEETEPCTGIRRIRRRTRDKHTHTQKMSVFIQVCQEGHTPQRDRKASVPSLGIFQVGTGLGQTLISVERVLQVQGSEEEIL